MASISKMRNDHFVMPKNAFIVNNKFKMDGTYDTNDHYQELVLQELPMQRRKANNPRHASSTGASCNLHCHHNQQEQQLFPYQQMQSQQETFGTCNSLNGHKEPSFVKIAAISNAATKIDPATLQKHDLSKLPALRQRIRRHAFAALQSLPSSQTQAYREALEHTSATFMTADGPRGIDDALQDSANLETDPLPFIRYCDYDLNVGVERMCRYWTERVKLFGKERAFLPLTLTGTGALTPHDLLCMRGGYPAMLPDNVKTGQKCALFDRRSRIPSATVDNLLRCLFYVFHVFAEDDLSQVHGALALFVAATPRSKEGDVDWVFIRRAAALLAEAFPVKITILILSVPQVKKPTYATKVVEGTVYILQQYIKYHKKVGASSSRLRVVVHEQTPNCPRNKILNDLLELGLACSGIPLFYGGDWAFSDFFRWAQSRMEWELERYKHHFINPTILGGSWVNETQRVTDNNGVTTSSVPVCSSLMGRLTKVPRTSTLGLVGRAKAGSDTTEERSFDQDPLAQQRLEDLIRSRRKRERKKVEFEKLKRNSVELQEQNTRLKEEQKRLQHLFAEAEQCVSQLSSPNISFTCASGGISTGTSSKPFQLSSRYNENNYRPGGGFLN